VPEHWLATCRQPQQASATAAAAVFEQPDGTVRPLFHLADALAEDVSKVLI
jgi:hypothetical protein